MEMKEIIEKTIENFGEFIKEHKFVIPNYQRAYSWEEKQLIPFLNDILEHYDKSSKYYLGHYILEKTAINGQYEIVDGQQRISTVYLFLLVCELYNGETNLSGIDFIPVSYDIDDLEKIKIILKSKIEIDQKLEELLKESKTSSLKRMINAVTFFKKVFEVKEIDNVKLDKSKIDEYVKVISESHFSKAIYKDKSVSSQIFELHNTRGVKLTETEKVKALLMKNVYINSKNADVDVKEIQENFAKIFEYEEIACEVWLRGDMPLDTILMYHLRAIEDGNKNESFNSPSSLEGNNGCFEYVKKSISIKSGVELVKYSKNLAREFAITMEIISKKIPEADKTNPLIGDVLLLDRNRSMIFLLRMFRSNDPLNNKLIEKWENFLLCYEIITWNGFFYDKSNSNRGKFDSIYTELKSEVNNDQCVNLISKYYKGTWFGASWEHLGENVKKSFDELKKNRFGTNTYNWFKTSYFLYKYEINNGSDRTVIRKNIFKGNTVSIDHIVAQNLPWQSLNIAEELRKSIDLVKNGIGNLSLSTSSKNSSDSNNLPEKHIKTYQEMGLIKTAEQVESWNNPECFASKIEERSDDIIKFILESIVERNDLWEK